MSRHKLVKGLDLNEELDDYDGAEDDTYEEEIAPEDKGDKELCISNGETSDKANCLCRNRASPSGDRRSPQHTGPGFSCYGPRDTGFFILLLL